LSIAAQILAELADSEPVAVAQVRVGRKYTAVELTDGSVGVALSQLPDGLGCCDGDVLTPAQLRRAHALLREAEVRLSARRLSSDLLESLPSQDPATAAAALACANAVANRATLKATDGDILEHLDLRPSDTVGMVGLFRPLVPGLRRTVETLHIFERHGGDGLLAADQAPHLLPACDVALITAGTIVNGTLDELLTAASACREVVLLGASTPLLPRAFRDTPVSWLSGSLVVDGPETLRVVAGGGGRREFGPCLRKANLRCR
jgi:uncharacterized protein (DUF4213/DUF364 family)